MQGGKQISHHHMFLISLSSSSCCCCCCFGPQVGTWYNTMLQQYTTVTGQTWRAGSNTGIYRNRQRASALWWVEMGYIGGGTGV